MMLFWLGRSTMMRWSLFPAIASLTDTRPPSGRSANTVALLVLEGVYEGATDVVVRSLSTRMLRLAVPYRT